MAAVLVVAVVGGCSFSDSDEHGSASSFPLEVDAQSSPRAVGQIPGERLDVYLEAGAELGLDWAVIAAVSGLETAHGQHGADAAPIEDALAIGYALQGAGAPGSYRAALTSRGGPAYARRALALADAYRGSAKGEAEPPGG